MFGFLEAAYQVLKDAGHPLNSYEITKQALEQGILKTNGKTPASTMASKLYVDIKEKGSASKFIQTGLNQFGLNNSPITTPPTKQVELSKDTFKPKQRVPQKNTKDSSILSAHELLDKEIGAMQTFLSGHGEKFPISEKICDWIFLCYSVGLYRKGAELFGYVDAAEVNGWYYERTKKMARLCELHQKN